MAATREIGRYLDDLEGLWACYDEVWRGFTPAQWGKRFGKDWVFADQPYHLAYFDRVILADALEAGEDMPEAERWVPRTMNELNAWNDREFAKRAPGQAPQQSIDEMRGVRDRLRAILSKFDDADLDTYRAWNHLLGGFTPLRAFLEMAHTHNWGEYTELLHRAGRAQPAPPPGTARAAIRFYLSFMQSFAKPEVAGNGFSVAWDFTGPASSQWTIRVGKRGAVLEEGLDPKADVTLRLTPDAFNILMLRRARNPMLAMLKGDLKVKGFSKMGKMQKIFPEPKPDEALEFSIAG